MYKLNTFLMTGFLKYEKHFKWQSLKHYLVLHTKIIHVHTCMYLIYFEASPLIFFPGWFIQLTEQVDHLMVLGIRRPWPCAEHIFWAFSARARDEIQSVSAACSDPALPVTLAGPSAPFHSPSNNISLHPAFLPCFCKGVILMTGVTTLEGAIGALGTLCQSHSSCYI